MCDIAHPKKITQVCPIRFAFYTSNGKAEDDRE